MKALFYILIPTLICININAGQNKINYTVTTKNSKDTTLYKTLIEKAELALKQGDFENAKINFTEANKIYPNKIEALYGLGVCHAFEGRKSNKECEVAINYFNRVILINTKYRRAYFNRALCYARLEKNTEAIIDLDKAISITPNDSDYYLERGKLKLKTEKASEGCSDLQKSINLGNKDAITIQQKFCK